MLRAVFFLFLILASGALPALAAEIHGAAVKGDLDAVKRILKASPDLLAARDEQGNTPLYLASLNGHLEVVAILIERGADVDAGDWDNSTALDVAARDGHTEVVALLIEKGAAVNHQDDNGLAPLHFAVTGNREEVVALLLEKGADPNLKVESGDGPIHMACAVGRCYENIVGPLLEHGADPNARSGDGATPLFNAVHDGRVEVIQQLIEHGADVNALSFGTITPLLAASRQEDADILALLLESGAKVDASDENGWTPLRNSVVNGNDEAVEMLLEHGADANAPEVHFQRTPLHWAAIKGNREAAELLVEHGAEVNAPDGSGHTPLFFAGRYGHRDVAGLLADRGGACEGMEENEGFSPQLKQPLDEGEAFLWYLGHCGWAVKTKNHLLIFDYWNPGKDPETPCLANGHIDPEEIGDQNVFVFVTHGHRDHYSKSVFWWKGDVERITYVMGFEPKRVPEYVYMGPREHREIGDVRIRTIEANDEGVGFLVEVDGLTLYHAGDHAGWREGERGGFTREIDYLADHVDRLDFAFLNVTGCHANGPEPLREGNRYTLEKLKVKVMIPTHALDREHLYWKTARELVGEDLPTRIYCPENRGDRFYYRASAVE